MWFKSVVDHPPPGNGLGHHKSSVRNPDITGYLFTGDITGYLFPTLGAITGHLFPTLGAITGYLFPTLGDITGYLFPTLGISPIFPLKK